MYTCIYYFLNRHKSLPLVPKCSTLLSLLPLLVAIRLGVVFGIKCTVDFCVCLKINKYMCTSIHPEKNLLRKSLHFVPKGILIWWLSDDLDIFFRAQFKLCCWSGTIDQNVGKAPSQGKKKLVQSTRLVQ